MKKDERYLNYLFTLGFILLIVIFIVSIVLISRVVLSDQSSISEHVKSTQSLLDNINDVESLKNHTDESSSAVTFLRLNLAGLNVTDISYYNVNENKSILTMFLTSQIENVGDVYYMKIKNFSTIQKNEVLVYNFNDEIRYGKFLDIDENLYIFNEINNDKVEKTDKSQILGRLIYDKNENN